MRLLIALVIAAAGLAAAQTSTTTAAGTSETPLCAAQNIVNACLGTTEPVRDACTPNDWACMCAAQEVVLRCYNNCPGDAARIGPSRFRDAWCRAAAEATSQSMALSGTPSSTDRAISTTSAAFSTTTSPLSLASSTSTKSVSTAAAAATAAMNFAAGGLLAVAVGIAGMQ